eukprot:3913943-Pleurochrysis_carterae.AAC.1
MGGTVASDVATAKAAVLASLPTDDSRTAYWEALSKFFRFEIDKCQFERLALSSLGTQVHLHNTFLRALLHSAFTGAPVSSDAVDDADSEEASRPTVGSPAAHGGILSTASIGNAVHSSGDSTCAASKANGSDTAAVKVEDADGVLIDVVGSTCSTTAQAHAHQPTGSFPRVGAGPVGAPLDPQLAAGQMEIAQVNALHDRLQEAVLIHGVNSIQPEAVSLVMRALRAHMHRLLAASSRRARDEHSLRRARSELGGETPSTFKKYKHGEATITTVELSATLKESAMSTNLLPPIQRITPAMAHNARRFGR